MKGLCVVLVIAVLACVRAEDDELIQRINGWADEFIEKATNDSGGFIDPLPLDNLGKSFEREVGFVKVKGEAKLYDGKIFGLSSLKRVGDAVAIDLEDFYIISTTLTFKKIHATYKGTVTVNNIGPQVTLDAKVGRSKVSMFLTAPAEGGKAELMSFTIHEMKDIRVNIKGLGPMGWSASIISTLVLNAMEKQVAKAASVAVFEHFSKEIDKVPFPGPTEQ
ncbi:mite allergen Der p 7-like [Uloborus diversus]|uniref:mite allergen Der p 7-like n=1 Tax=Uloborus diversus TaxID=327109 RepID=UPI0024099711|nr:mite allergen Der p 7-like [Uloborus diversus]XP_054722289.1 mite allergen Der p 7-like [Uloborus diversus]XP_054722290.1 mite allergen Der p 7-like [Uloborus diversus]